MKRHTICFSLFSLLCAASVSAQSFTYVPSTGIMTARSGAIDLVAILLEGPDVSVTGCNLCDGMQLPGTDALGNASDWTVGFANGSTQWIRTQPLQGVGFRGTIASNWIDGNGDLQPWPADFLPFNDFPDEGMGLAIYPTGLTSSDFGTVTYSTDMGGMLTTTVTFDDAGDNPAGASPAGMVPPSGLDLTGDFEFEGDVDFYSFEAVAGEEYTATLSLDNLADLGSLSILDVDQMTSLAMDGPGNPAMVTFTAPSTGTFYAGATFGGGSLQEGGPSAYGLNISVVPEPSAIGLVWLAAIGMAWVRRK